MGSISTTSSTHCRNEWYCPASRLWWGKSLGQWFGFCPIVSFFTAYLTGHTLDLSEPNLLRDRKGKPKTPKIGLLSKLGSQFFGCD
jgi:hypothetical protein